MVLAPLVRGKKGKHKDIIPELIREGFVRLRIDGEVVEADPETELDKKKKHTIEAVVDRLVVKPSSKNRLADSVETALRDVERHRAYKISKARTCSSPNSLPA